MVFHPKSFLLASLAIVSLVSQSSIASDAAERQRFSLAISGGASKGAYEAGLNWALLKMARESENIDNWSGGQIRHLELASVSGASAGGVNSILSGLTWCSLPESEGGIASRIDDNVFRDSWFVMDINGLLPPHPESETYLPGDALFSRRDYLVAANELLEGWRKSSYRPGCRVPMGVTATRVKPLELVVENIAVQNQRFYIPFELQVQEDGSIGFYFDPGKYPELSDPSMILMPRPGNAPENSIPDESIIEAAVITSAFPGAFGRRRIQHCLQDLEQSRAPAGISSPQSDSDLVCPDGYILEEAEFADGGLFDNLPVGLARKLAEASDDSQKSSGPVTYFYMDPDRVRYEQADPPDNSACASDNPPEACLIMDFSLFSETSLLLGALGTARKYELYRETTSAPWRHNLSQLAYELSSSVAALRPDLDCDKELPFFDTAIDCAEAIQRAGRLLEIAHDRVKPEILQPYSVDRLTKAGVVSNCEPAANAASGSPLACDIDVAGYRQQLGEAMISIVQRGETENKIFADRVALSSGSYLFDRVLRVTSRGAPITGTLLGDFGSFLDLKFREYDYYVGVYDAMTMVSDTLCNLQYLSQEQAKEFGHCIEKMAGKLYQAMGVTDDPRGQYVIARIAEKEFGDEGLLAFLYSPLPAVDRDMQIIHEALAAALDAGEGTGKDKKGLFATENSFFEYLQKEGFTPTSTENGDEPLLTAIIADPDTWATEMTRRFTARMVYLEREAADIYAEREPDRELRENSYTPLTGISAHVLQTATYKYPDFTFSPSTAPENWIWRYLMPYDLGLDLAEGDVLFTWQPTMAITADNLLNVRASLGFEGGLLRSSSDDLREDYLALGVGYIRRTGKAGISSYGFTPTWYHSWSQPEIGDQDTFGGDIFVAFLTDRFRVGLGTRDFDNARDNWFLTLTFTDLPGMTYWLTR